MVADIRELLKMMEKKKASDLYIVADSPPVLRIGGRLVSSTFDFVNAEKAKELIYQILNEDLTRELEKEKELDCSFNLPGVARFRVNVHFQKGTVAAAFRTVPIEIPSREDLLLPPIIEELSNEPNGFVLVTGPTGSGKSTTLSVMIDYINRTRDCHIITIEDPIEYIHLHNRSTIEQREVGIDTRAFQEALKRALRQDPNVILVGEMRDLETMATAITAAETGHLVLSTLHTNDAVQAVDRMIDVFPPHQQDQIRLQLSLTLRGILSQRLLPRLDGKGRVVAVEILKVTPAVANIVRKGKTHEIYSIMEIGAEKGMKTMKTALKELFESGLIAFEEYSRFADKY
jgi:twitching motility protein PilT